MACFDSARRTYIGCSRLCRGFLDRPIVSLPRWRQEMSPFVAAHYSRLWDLGDIARKIYRARRVRLISGEISLDDIDEMTSLISSNYVTPTLMLISLNTVPVTHYLPAQCALPKFSRMPAQLRQPFPARHYASCAHAMPPATMSWYQHAGAMPGESAQ